MKRLPFTSLVLAVTAWSFLLGKVLASTQTDIIGPAGSVIFGSQVTVLPNGNFVVTDPAFTAPGSIMYAGRVYLYNGSTLALINTMTGSAANDSIGHDQTGKGVTVLANGDYVVVSASWNDNRGAVTKCSAVTGCPATISPTNSLVGADAGASVGFNGVVALPNGNYVVRSSAWDNGNDASVGAITWCDGASTCTGTMSPANSIVGSTSGDLVEAFTIVVLANGIMSHRIYFGTMARQRRRVR